MRWVFAVVALTGCNQIFDLREADLQLVDAPPDAGPVTIDEDLDGVMDAVDNCPGAYNPQQSDMDMDSVGDACDPHVTTPGDFVAAREYFAGPNGYAWTPNAGTSWTLHDGLLQSSAAIAGSEKRLMLQVTAPYPTLELGFTVDQYVLAGGDSIEISLNFSNSDINCFMSGTSPGEKLDVVEVRVGPAAYAVQSLQQVTEHVPLVLRETRDAMGAKCSFGSTNTSYAFVTPTETAVTASITVRDMQASLNYAVIYGVQ